jgi:peptide/nickel transport system permease protein
MLKYIVKRLLLSVPLVLGIVTATFFMSHLAPGDPMDMYLEPQRQRQMDPEVIELLRERYGLDQPIHVQYVTWLKNFAQGDFGESFRHRRPVRDMLVEAVPYTLQLTILAIILDALVGITIGIISAVKQYSKLDKAVTVGSLIIYAIPSFWLALMLIMVFSVNLGWFPTSQTRSMNYEDLTAIGKMLDRMWHLALPVFVMGIAGAAGTARYMRNKLLEVLNEEYMNEPPVPARRRHDHRDDLRVAGHGPAHGGRSGRAGLPDHHGHGHDRGRPDRARQPARRHHLCRRGPEGVLRCAPTTLTGGFGSAPGCPAWAT